MARGRLRPSIVTWSDFLDDDGIPSFPDQVFLAEGDSWFTISGFPAFNLLFELRFHKHTQIVNLGLPGDTIKGMSQIAGNRNLRSALSPGGRRWDAILLSGGGNDLIDDADEIVLPKSARPANPASPADYCDQARLARLIADVQAGYRRIAALRDAPRSPGRGVPIVAHTYDYSTPRNAPVRFLFGSLGPWLFPVMKQQDVPGSDWVALADYLADTLAEGILALANGPEPIPAFHVVDTRDTLKRADLGSRGDNNDWQNEIHPNGDGYEKLAKKIEPVLESLVGQ